MKLTEEQITSIINKWTKVSKKAHAHYDTILTIDDLTRLTVAQLKETVNYSKMFISEMEALFCDFRHILGMTKMKVTDRNKLISLFIDITSFRSDAKRIAQCNDVLSLKFIPAQSKYKLKLNQDIELISELREGQTSGEIIDESKELEIDSVITSSNLIIEKIAEGKIDVSFSLDDASTARRLFAAATKQTNIKDDSNYEIDMFINKLNAGKSYGFDVTEDAGIWTVHLTNEQQDKVHIYDYFKTKINR